MSISSRLMLSDKETFLREKETMRIDWSMARANRVMVAGLWALIAIVLTGCATVDARDTSARDPSLPAATNLQRVVDEAHAKFKDLKDGKNADYIPILATVPSELFGVVIVTKDGKIYEKGDTNYVFAIESTSKPFNAALVMKEQGPEAIKEKIGVEPTGLPFNSKMAIAAFSPRLNEAGNSVRAQNAIKYISDELNLSIFDGR